MARRIMKAFMLTIAHRMRAFARRSPEDRVLLLHAFALHLGIAVLYRAVPFGWLTRTLERRYPVRNHDGAAPDMTAGSRAIWAATTSAALTPRSATCLTISLTAQCLVRHLGSDAVLRFGVLRETRPRLAAHAWLESAGRPLPGLSLAADHLALE